MTDEILDRERRPATIREAVEYLRLTMPQQALAELAAMAKDQLIQTHYGLGAGIRNEVLRDNHALRKDTGQRHPDDASTVIVEALWRELQTSAQ
jgi:hypothetical protein